MPAAVTCGREAAGSDGSHRGGGPHRRHSAGSVVQAPLLSSQFPGTHSPVWLTFTRAENQPNRWAWWQATKDAVNARCLGVGDSSWQSGKSKSPPATQPRDDSTEIGPEQPSFNIFRNSPLRRQKKDSKMVSWLTVLLRYPVVERRAKRKSDCHHPPSPDFTGYFM